MTRNINFIVSSSFVLLLRLFVCFLSLSGCQMQRFCFHHCQGVESSSSIGEQEVVYTSPVAPTWSARQAIKRLRHHRISWSTKRKQNFCKRLGTSDRLVDGLSCRVRRASPRLLVDLPAPLAFLWRCICIYNQQNSTVSWRKPFKEFHWQLLLSASPRLATQSTMLSAC